MVLPITACSIAAHAAVVSVPGPAPAENSSMLVGAVVRAEPTLYAIAVGGTLM
jgi:hypothetical protein